MYELQYRTSDGALLYVDSGPSAGALAYECCCNPCPCDNPLDTIHVVMDVTSSAYDDPACTVTIEGDLNRTSACTWWGYVPATDESCNWRKVTGVAISVSLEYPCRWLVSVGGVVDPCWVFKDYDDNDPTGAYADEPNNADLWAIRNVVIS